MKLSLKYLILLLSFCFFLNLNNKLLADSLPIIVISAGKTEQSMDTVGSSIDVIDAEMINNSPYSTIGEIINSNSTSNNFFHLGGPGGNTGIQLRGLEKRYSTVYLDGVKMMDPSSSDGSFYLDNLTKNGIQRIEILKGTQSSLYGSNAIGGTINLFTKLGTNQTTSNFDISKGSNNTRNISFSKSNSKKNFNYFFGLNKYLTDGISAMNDNKEKDMYRNDNMIGNLQYKINEIYIIQNSTRIADTFYEYDEVDKNKSDENTNTDNLELSNSLKLIYNNKNITNTISYNKLLIERYTTDYAANKQNYFGYRDSLNLLSEYNYNLDNKIIYGFDFETDAARYKKDYGTNDLFHDESIVSQYFNFQSRPFEKIFSSFGLRNDTHSTAGNEKSLRTTLAYKFNNNNKIRTSYGTGVRFPSLYDYAYGYQTIVDLGGSLEDLKAEKGIGFDLGYDAFFPKFDLNLSTTYFKTKQKNPILSNARTGWVMKNLKGTNTSEGIELDGNWNPINKKYNFNFGYTFTHSYDANTCDAEELASYADNECRNDGIIATSKVRVPRHALKAKFNYKFDKLLSSVKAEFASRRRDFGNINDGWRDQTLRTYLLFDISNSYNISDGYKIYFNINNIFNEKYEQAWEYSMPKRNLYFGFKKIY